MRSSSSSSRSPHRHKTPMTLEEIRAAKRRGAEALLSRPVVQDGSPRTLQGQAAQYLVGCYLLTWEEAMKIVKSDNCMVVRKYRRSSYDRKSQRYVDIEETEVVPMSKVGSRQKPLNEETKELLDQLAKAKGCHSRRQRVRSRKRGGGGGGCYHYSSRY